MKKNKKLIIISTIAFIILVASAIIFYKMFIDINSLTIKEKKWVDSHSSNVISITVPNDLPVFGNTGVGVFFDFTSYLTDEVGLNINNNTTSYNDVTNEYGFDVTTKYDNNGLLLYKDHYVLVSKSVGIIDDSSTIKNLHPAVINTSADLIKSYYGINDEQITIYDNYAKISEDLGNGNIQYALVSLTEYKDELISNNINIICHVSDLNKYYYFKLGNDEMLNNILKKKFNYWKNNEFEDSYNINDYNLFIKNLKITEAEIANLKSKTYKYGFVENRPYEVSTSGSYGGLTFEYINAFEKFSGVDFNYKKYKNATEVAENAIKGNIDIYYNYYDIVTNYIDSGALKNINYYVIANNSIDLSMSSLNSLAYRKVYVLANSYLETQLKNIEGIELVTYEKTSELKQILKKDSIVVVDEATYNYYITNLTNNYTVRYKGIINNNHYSFRYSNDKDTFYKLFSAYTKTIDPQDLLRIGITSYNKVDNKGNVIGTIAYYVLLIVIVSVVVSLFYRRKTTVVKLDTKVKKDDRLKYIDLLTSLKNRNYYNEKISVWNKNTIYPQACIVMDINKVKFLNDSYGYMEGDKQIQAVANILFKTQIDNTEVMRTDGNEFFVYMVGYNEKQVLTYMKKLVKEFKKLPYDYGVAMGFAMIENDTKLIDDAFNEASNKMRENKELFEDNNEK